MQLKVSELKDELSELHGLSVADVAKHFGSRKNVLQNRLLNDLEGMLPPSDEGGEEGERGENNVVDIVIAEQSQNTFALQSAATATACDPNAMQQLAQPSNDDDDDDDDDRIMEVVVPTEETMEDAPETATTTSNEEMLRSSRTGGADNHLQSPPKVSEAAGDRSAGNDAMELEQDPVVHVPSVDSAEFASAPAESHPTAPHVVESNGQRSNGAVDTTVASIPFDEMDVDAKADAMKVDANKLEPVVEADSCRKRSRSPAAPSSSSSSSMSSMSFVKVPHPSTCGKETSTSSEVEQVQSTFNNMSVQHSPLRKFAKVNDSSKGTAVVAAPHHRNNNDDDADVPTGKSLTDPGPSWVDQRTAELAKQSQTLPKPARGGAGGFWKASATTAPPLSSATSVSKLYADDKFPSTTSYQPQSVAAATKTQPRSGGGGIPTAPAAADKGNLIEKMRTKVRPPSPSSCNQLLLLQNVQFFLTLLLLISRCRAKPFLPTGQHRPSARASGLLRLLRYIRIAAMPRQARARRNDGRR
jgi:hypothetical protein